eukprot:COSAG02_NODE_36568_length_453_cov_0.725989_1_plen_92_part_10
MGRSSPLRTLCVILITGSAVISFVRLPARALAAAANAWVAAGRDHRFTVTGTDSTDLQHDLGPASRDAATPGEISYANLFPFLLVSSMIMI